MADLMPSEQVVLRVLRDLSAVGPVRTIDLLHSCVIAKTSFYDALKRLEQRGFAKKTAHGWMATGHVSGTDEQHERRSEITACRCESSARLWFLFAPDGHVAGVGFSPLASLRSNNRTINKSVRLWAIRELVRMVSGSVKERYEYDAHVLQRVHVQLGHVHCGKGSP